MTTDAIRWNASRSTGPAVPAVPDSGAAANRWMLHRAGIINVYQYGNETLHFGGGRLLLRGVNGSGKSTAMNMLLPFLLDGDTRRIDAAGEQSGVLRSWMLSGREEPQPQGYLWIELARGDERLSFGCGIRANRSTDRVTTWWFITSLRPGIDLHLVEGRVPLGPEKLRAGIQPGVVYAHDQRAAYRADLRARLFGGSDLDQHLRLLHIVRNPRVGDRLDADLPRHLEDALPQLSDAALDDAAQPLEDLEEHRRNVLELRRTAEALSAIQEVYRGYARSELHRIAGATMETVAQHDERRRAEARALEAFRRAKRRLEVASESGARHTQEIAQRQEEIRSFEASQAYQSGAQLSDLRGHLASLERATDAARDDAERRRTATLRSSEAVRQARREVDDERESLRQQLSRLTDLSSSCGLAARPPGTPQLAMPPELASPSEPPTAPADAGPEADLDTTLPDRELDQLRAAAQHRVGDLRELEQAVVRVDAAEQSLRAAERAAQEADWAQAAARTERDEALSSFHAGIAQWKTDALAWSRQLRRHCDVWALGETGETDRTDEIDESADRNESAGLDQLDELDAMDIPPELEDPASRVVQGESLSAPLRERIDRVLQQHQTRCADLEAVLARHAEAVAESEARVAELAARQLPEPPVQPWQQRDGRPCLAEWIDFAEELDAASRAGLEAAMEASGLLAAEVLGEEGGLRLADGQLLVAEGGAALPSSLADWLRVSHPDDDDEGDGGDGSDRPRGDGSARAEVAAVERVLRCIATDLEAIGVHTVVTTGGEFRLGALRGRHHKVQAEHVGRTARRAALERQRAEAARDLDLARQERDRMAARVETARTAIAEASALRRAIPPEQDLLTALGRRDQAERQLERATEHRRQRHAERAAAERDHATALEDLHRTSARLALPRTLEELRRIGADLAEIVAGCREAKEALARLAQAVSRWRLRNEDWATARADQQTSEKRVDEVGQELDLARTRLATLQESIGAEYARIVAAIRTSQAALERARSSLEEANREQLAAQDEVAATRERHAAATADLERSEQECLRLLPLLQRTLAVPGLVLAALRPPESIAEPQRDPPPASDTEPPPGPQPDAGAPPAPGARADAGPSPRPDAQAVRRSEADDRVSFPAVDSSPEGARQLAEAVRRVVPAPGETRTSADGVRQSLRRRRDTLGAGWDAEDHQPDEALPLRIEVTGPIAPQLPLPEATDTVERQLRHMTGLLSAKQDQALRNLLQGLVAREVADKLHAARELIDRMNQRLSAITTAHGIGVSLRWRQSDDLDPGLAATVALLAKPPDLRTADEDGVLSRSLGERIDEARRDEPEIPYRELIARVLDYRSWHRMTLVLHRPGRPDERLGRRTALSEGEKKIVSYLPLFAAVAASCDALAANAPDAPRFVLLDDAFAKVSEDNHAKLFGLLVELDLDFIATSERLWGTHDTVPELAISEVIRDAELGTIVLEHSRWDGHRQELR